MDLPHACIFELHITISAGVKELVDRFHGERTRTRCPPGTAHRRYHYWISLQLDTRSEMTAETMRENSFPPLLIATGIIRAVDENGG